MSYRGQHIARTKQGGVNQQRWSWAESNELAREDCRDT